MEAGCPTPLLWLLDPIEPAFPLAAFRPSPARAKIRFPFPGTLAILLAD
jgi:hypothetical protein